MQNRTRIPTAKARSTLLVAVLLAAVAVLTFLPISAADAQTETPTPTPTAALPDGSELNLKARATERGVELSWEAAVGAVRYELITWWDQNLSWQPIGGDNLTGTTYTHTEVAAGTKYLYSIRAVNADGEAGRWVVRDYPTATALAPTGAGTSTPTATAAPETSTPTPAPAASERDALVALYEATAGDNWTQNNNWLSDRPLSTWHGVSTGAGGRVTRLDLSGNQLSGPLPDLSALTSLEELALTSNLLTGPIPSLSAFSSLTTLTLSHNRLTGPIPDLSSLTSLTTLYLINNQLSGPIPDLGALTNLVYLDFMRNRLSGPIPNLSNLTGLRALSLGHNRLTGSVPDLRALPNLGSLALQHNQLTGPVPDLTGSNLRQLNLTGNQLCLPRGVDFTRGNQVVVAHFRTLDMSSCTDVTPTATATALTAAAPVLTATYSGANEVELSWTAVPGAVRYALWTQVVDDSEWEPLGGGNLQATSYRHKDLTPGATYRYAVRGVDTNGRELGPWSNYPTVTVPTADAATATATATPTAGFTPTATPTASPSSAPLLTARYVGANEIELNWTAVSGAVRYVLFTQLVAERGWQQLDEGNLIATTYRHREFTPGATYQYAVRAVDANGQPLGPWSNFPTVTVPTADAATATATPTAGPTPTPTPTASTSSAPLLTARYVGANEIELNWTAVSGAVRYVLFTQLVAERGWQQLDEGNLIATTYRHREFTPGATYQYAVRAVDANGQPLGPWSNFPTVTVPTADAATATATPTAGPTPTPTPTASTSSAPVLTATYSGANEVELSWAAVSGADRYMLWTQVVDASEWERLDRNNLHDTSFRHRDLTPGATYRYAVRAVDANDRWLGPWSNFPTVTVPASTERDALVALYEATDGDNWGRSDNWLSDRPLSSWHGVTTDAGGRVTRLELSANRLSGQLPDLSALAYLERLALASNRLTGPIPRLSAFSSLTTLYLSHNGLSGPIPDLSGLTSLTTLYLINNQLNGPIPDLGALTNLADLDLMRNRLSGPIPDLSNLTGLRSLSLGHNRLTGSVPDLRALTNLGGLALQHNRLTGPVPDLTGSNLRQLNLTGNQLCLPQGADFSRGNQVVVAHFRTLNLSPCSGVAPPTTSQLPTAPPTSTAPTQPSPDSAEERAALIALYRATDGANWNNNDNWLTGAPLGTWHGVFTDESGHVVELRLEQNELRGSLSALNALTYLTTLYLYDNQLTGPIPDLSALTDLEYVWMSDNQLTGPIPALNTITNLRYLNLGYNKLSGPIPELSALTNLQVLILNSNQLTGSIPDLSAQAYLWNLTLFGNQLTGSIRAQSLPPDLWVLSLDSNQLTGSIPDLSMHTNLSYLHLSSNQLSGPIPDLSAFTNLADLYLGDNQLSGSIPDLSALTKLRSLSLGQNQLTGPIPDVSTLTELDYLRLDSNQLTGPMPDVSALTKLTSLTLSYNQLTGPILDLNHLTRLTSLSLRYNQLTGPAPDLSALTNLTWLTLRGNQLCLPQGFGLSGANQVVTEHLNSLNLPACTAAELALTPGAPQNLTATIGDGQVTLTWSAVANAAGYELRVWDSINREWGGIGGDLRVTSYTHSVLKDGRNYYYQVRARDANGVRGAWSEQEYAAVISPRYPPPPVSLQLDMFYQKYLETNGVIVVAPSDVSDAKMAQAREIITGMLSNRPDLLQTMAASHTIIFIEIDDIRGIAYKIPGGWKAYVRADDLDCGNFIHEFAHVIHFAIEDQADGPAFNTRLRSLYQTALNAGLWEGMYASTEAVEYWAEAVKYWLWGSSPYTGYATLADYDPEITKLIEEELGADARVPADCKVSLGQIEIDS